MLPVWFHVTPAVNVDTIAIEGLRPECARSPMKAVWVVGLAQLPWAVLHCICTHPVTRDYMGRAQIAVYEIGLGEYDWKSFSLHRALFYTLTTVLPADLRPVHEAEFLGMFERTERHELNALVTVVHRQ